MLIFQSTLPRRERPLLLILLRDGEHFNPRSHEGSDCTNSVPFFVYLCISIHAPARGATSQFRYLKASSDFNPRSRERSDLLFLLLCMSCPISIHAPARGATVIAFDECHKSKISIHAPARGATDAIQLSLDNGYIFQSTLPREERRKRL